jgi:hypothetical protein
VVPRQGNNAAGRRIGVTCAALRPGIARDHEAVARHIEQVKIGLQRRPLQYVDLRIDENQRPSALCQYSQTQ